jgi:hypothetical protein
MIVLSMLFFALLTIWNHEAEAFAPTTARVFSRSATTNNIKNKSLVLVSKLSRSTRTLEIPTSDTFLVVGANGRSGRMMVERLLMEGKKVRALVRDSIEGRSLFQSPRDNLEVIAMDLARFEENENLLRKAFSGCCTVYSMCDEAHFSKLTHFLPFCIVRVFTRGRDHPYYTNYLAQLKLMELALQHRIRRFVRQNGVNLFQLTKNPLTLLYNMVLSVYSLYYVYVCSSTFSKESESNHHWRVWYYQTRQFVAPLQAYQQNAFLAKLKKDPSYVEPPSRLERFVYWRHSGNVVIMLCLLYLVLRVVFSPPQR